ncbi:hypothetical protein HYH02_011166 [Chlamydomonas schloesseri]|uniref:SGNH hydrolase-type esterase domain-containing protein n=1 Tax=Chlamydomonas schloesseri TaxID=2026947 RepID=A0A835T784_9CHLO|nr:hypothetical protein HYH02_011166 [Chlamydomonas schloesseri]|eukprot:KAG2437523.1 hypothetical protein HYH02_011166 [Chlamydomonas schloesseri]
MAALHFIFLAALLAFGLLGPRLVHCAFSFDLPTYALRRSVQNCCNSRVLRIIQDLEAGKALTIAVVGGSFSLPDRISTDDVWFSQLARYLRDTYPRANITAINAAVGASNAGFGYLCLSKMLPPEVDLVFLDYGPNVVNWSCDITNQHQYYEQLIRRLLAYPGNPAVVAIEQLLPTQRPMYTYSEVTASALYRYYDMPYISVSTGIYRLQALNASGFAEHEIRMPNPVWGYWHYNRRGHKLVLDMVVHMLRSARASELAGIWPEQRDPFWADQTPGGRTHSTLLPQHPVKQPLLCVMPEELHTYVVSHAGWKYGADDPNSRKYGYISYRGQRSNAEKRLVMKWDRSAIASKVGPESSSFALILVYLASYSGMGSARLTCSGGCTCAAQTIDATIADFSLSKVRPVSVNLTPHQSTTAAAGSSADAACQVEVVNTSPGGKHSKFKVTGFVLAEMYPGTEKEIGKVAFMNHGGGVSQATVK